MAFPSLTLRSGSSYRGISFGAERNVSGEAVFATGMVGYPESLSDPSYAGQILVLTYPLIGNYGVPANRRKNGLEKHFESSRIQVVGLVVGNYQSNFSHWQATRSLGKWLSDQGIPALTGVDTRRLTQELRTFGSMPAKLLFHSSVFAYRNIDAENIVESVSTKHPIYYRAGKRCVVLIDCGVKQSIIKNFLRRGVSVRLVPWDYKLPNRQLHYNGVVISNGPGNPKRCLAAINNIRVLLHQQKPVLGICLGAQLMALAAGASTYKLKYGHRSQNQPCQDLKTKRCYITSQNHGYAIRASSLPRTWRIWLQNCNDQTIEGIQHRTKSFWAVQFHPEAQPGPTDTNFIFDDFIRLLR